MGLGARSGSPAVPFVRPNHIRRLVATAGFKAAKDLYFGFCENEIFPTRRVKFIFKLYCIEDLIRRGFI